jgi:hypothetical protein
MGNKLTMVAIRPTNNTLSQGFFPGPRCASRLGKSPTLLIANATREPTIDQIEIH